MPTSSLYIGLMSGTSLDGVDGVLASFDPHNENGTIRTIASAYVPFSEQVRQDLMALQQSGTDEIHREALAANTLATHYADCTARLLNHAGVSAAQVDAVGVHGQTIRHRPELGFTRQTNNPALLAELCGIDVIADFRSRDIAAGGQGAPLVPAFHQAVFGSASETRVVANIGGIANISVLPASSKQSGSQAVIGFDTGPGNVLMDAWIAQHKGLAYDEDGRWASSGKILPALLKALLDEPFFSLAPPKSTGRDLFHMAWLNDKLTAFGNAAANDVQATLAALTAATIADAIAEQASSAASVHICGGGAYNSYLMGLLQQALVERTLGACVESTAKLGVSPNHVEALAFAWLAYRFKQRQAGNLASVTGAKGERILGALYPA